MLVSVTGVRAEANEGVSLPKSRMFLGVYDPAGTFSSLAMDVEEYFISPDPDQMASALADARSKSRVPVVTIEWICPPDSEDNVLVQMSGGRYDVVLASLVSVAQGFQGQIIVRLFHEMELSDLYCWGKGSPREFIDAFRYARDVFRRAENVLWAWSPAGNNNAGDFYPGDYYVDLVGFTLLASDSWDRMFGVFPPQSFRKLMNEKGGRMAKFGKPVFIAEFGVARPTQSERKWWLELAYQNVKSGKYPYLVGIVYFNAPNAANAHTGKDVPHWEITPDMFWKPLDMPKLTGR